MKFIYALLGVAATINAIVLPESSFEPLQARISTTDDECLSVGDVCAGPDGPTGQCCPGSFCFQKLPGYFICRRSFGPGPACHPPGEVCATIKGPNGICCPGSECHYEFPDYATCRVKLSTTTTSTSSSATDTAAPTDVLYLDL